MKSMERDKKVEELLRRLEEGLRVADLSFKNTSKITERLAQNVQDITSQIATISAAATVLTTQVNNTTRDVSEMRNEVKGLFKDTVALRAEVSQKLGREEVEQIVKGCHEAQRDSCPGAKKTDIGVIIKWALPIGGAIGTGVGAAIALLKG